jgi:hypothetical protein
VRNCKKTIIFLASSFYRKYVSVLALIRLEAVLSMFVDEEVYGTKRMYVHEDESIEEYETKC